MTERTFTIAGICAAVGISPARLHQWIGRARFEPIRHIRAGVVRQYTLRVPSIWRRSSVFRRPALRSRARPH